MAPAGDGSPRRGRAAVAGPRVAQRRAFWDRRADRYAANVKATDVEGDPFLQALRRATNTTGTAIDVGAGTGRFALALAGGVRHVTAVDPSAGMLEFLRRDAERVGVLNVTTVQATWEEAATQVADVVFSAFVLTLVPDARRFVSKLDAAAHDRVLLYLGAYCGDGCPRPPLAPLPARRARRVPATSMRSPSCTSSASRHRSRSSRSSTAGALPRSRRRSSTTATGCCSPTPRRSGASSLRSWRHGCWVAGARSGRRCEPSLRRSSGGGLRGREHALRTTLKLVALASRRTPQQITAAGPHDCRPLRTQRRRSRAAQARGRAPSRPYSR